MITGIVIADAAADFARVQRRQTWSRLARRLQLRPDHESELLAFDEVVGALGRTGHRELGLHSVEIDTIIGSVDRVGDFDRWFRPRPPVDRQRWIDLDRAGRAGAIIPPIEVFRVGRLHFVRDGHHRVSVARAHGQRSIEAFVTEVTTRVVASPDRSPPPNPDTSPRDDESAQPGAGRDLEHRAIRRAHRLSRPASTRHDCSNGGPIGCRFHQTPRLWRIRRGRGCAVCAAGSSAA